MFDIRNTKEEVQVFRGHKKEASAVAWHPIHEGVFASGGSDGAIMFWSAGSDKETGAIEMAHESIVWSLGIKFNNDVLHAKWFRSWTCCFE